MKSELLDVKASCSESSLSYLTLKWMQV